MSKPSPPEPTTPVVVVATPGVLLLDLAGVAEPFRLANQLPGLERAPFALSLAAPSARVRSSLPVALAGLAPLPRRLPAGAWVVVCGVAERAVAAAERAADEAALVAWLRAVVGPALDAGSARLLTVCSGALFAARAGLLDGRACTTHHTLVETLAREHPLARVQANRIFVRDGRVATSAGVTAGIDLALAAIAEKLGNAAALAVARELVVYLRRAGGDPQLSPWLMHRNHLHAAVHRAQDAVLAEPAARWSVAALARAAHVTPRHLARLFADNAGVAPLEYLQSVRIELAERLLREGASSVERAAEAAGFSSAQHLRRVWRRVRGGTPRASSLTG